MADGDGLADEDPLVEGVDYYVENGFLVLTAHYLRRRGHCCRNACRHCPYGYGEASADGREADDPGQGRFFE